MDSTRLSRTKAKGEERQPPGWTGAGETGPHSARVAHDHGVDSQRPKPRGIGLSADELDAAQRPPPDLVAEDMGHRGKKQADVIRPSALARGAVPE